MKHIKPISLAADTTSGNISVLEQAILLTISIFFSDWANFSAVIQNLQKFYRKT